MISDIFLCNLGSSFVEKLEKEKELFLEYYQKQIIDKENYNEVFNIMQYQLEGNLKEKDQIPVDAIDIMHHTIQHEQHDQQHEQHDQQHEQHDQQHEQQSDYYIQLEDTSFKNVIHKLLLIVNKMRNYQKDDQRPLSLFHTYANEFISKTEDRIDDDIRSNRVDLNEEFNYMLFCLSENEKGSGVYFWEVVDQSWCSTSIPSFALAIPEETQGKDSTKETPEKTDDRLPSIRSRSRHGRSTNHLGKYRIKSSTLPEQFRTTHRYMIKRANSELTKQPRKTRRSRMQRANTESTKRHRNILITKRRHDKLNASLFTNRSKRPS